MPWLLPQIVGGDSDPLPPARTRGSDDGRAAAGFPSKSLRKLRCGGLDPGSPGPRGLPGGLSTARLRAGSGPPAFGTISSELLRTEEAAALRVAPATARASRYLVRSVRIGRPGMGTA